jgi:putative DNA methylase
MNSTSYRIISPKKLIEVALPLDAINAAAAREKSIRHGHPSTLHLWWARRPLAAARAVIFSQLVHDPEDLWRCQNPDKEPNAQVKGHWTKARARLFSIIEDLVKWESTTDETVLEKAREEIRRSWQETCDLNKDHPQMDELFNHDQMPGLHDPFAGGGAIPLEAQRLGLDAYASDLNPVAVLINKAMIEIPPKFTNRPPVRRESAKSKSGKLGLEESWNGASGLAEDVSYYGQWMRDEAEKRIGHLYPKVEITKKMVAERPDLKPYLGENLTVIAWLWARTVKSPNPAFSHVDVPLANTFILSSKTGKESYVDKIIAKDGYEFIVKVGMPPEAAKTGTSAGSRRGFRCLLSDIPIAFEYIRGEGLAGRMGQKLMAIVVEGNKGRIYLSPTVEQENTAISAQPTWQPETLIPDQALSIRVQLYGMRTHGKLFTPRQLVALTTFSDLVREARERIRRDAVAAGLTDDDIPLDIGGTGVRAYAEAVSVYLAFSIDKAADYWSTLCTWHNSKELIRNTFGKHALPMTWDYAETNAFSESAGNVSSGIDWAVKVIERLPIKGSGMSSQNDAQNQNISMHRYVSTDPPYYDNIGYADLSDYFYVWLRRSLRVVFPTLLATVTVPKAEELVATPYRHHNRENAEKFFLEGMTQAMRNLALNAHPASPITIYYAFKQSETAIDGTASSGWVTFLESVQKAGLALTGTWPMRTELGNRMISSGTNALASSIILVCRPREKNAGTIGRRQFIRLLNEALPLALDAMTRESEGLHSPVAPVDLSQAIIGPGMAIFSRYEAVLEADGSPMTIKTALQLINRFLAEDDFDADTQFCLHWFEQYGWETGKFGEADTLARAKGTSVDGVKHAGVIHAASGNVRLLKWAEYPNDWDPQTDQRLPIWEVLHQLIRVFNTDGEAGAAEVFAAVQSKAEAARQLAYRLYTLCERKNWAEDARAYNEVVTSWSGIETAASKEPSLIQRELFDN